MKVHRLNSPFDNLINEYKKQGKVKTYSHKISAELDRQLSELIEQNKKKIAMKQYNSWKAIRDLILF